MEQKIKQFNGLKEDRNGIKAMQIAFILLFGTSAYRNVCIGGSALGRQGNKKTYQKAEQTMQV